MTDKMELVTWLNGQMSSVQFQVSSWAVGHLRRKLVENYCLKLVENSNYIKNSIIQMSQLEKSVENWSTMVCQFVVS